MDVMDGMDFMDAMDEEPFLHVHSYIPSILSITSITSIPTFVHSYIPFPLPPKKSGAIVGAA
jgi:hypothetical protein